MTRSIAALIAITLCVSACQDRGLPAGAYKRWSDRWIVRLGLINLGIYPCRGMEPPEHCLRLDPPRRWKGLWFNEFEGSRFCPAPAQTCGPEGGDRIDLEWTVRFPPKWKGLRYNRVYEVDFVGRRTSGRMNYQGVSYLIFGDRLISLNEVQPPQIR